MDLNDELRSIFFIFFSLKAIFKSFFGYFGAPSGPHLCPMYPYGPWPLVLSLTRHIEANNNSFHDFCVFKQVYFLQKSLFFNLGSLKAPLEPKLFQTSPNGLIHLNLCFGGALSQKMDLVYEFRSFFSIFSFWLSF